MSSQLKLKLVFLWSCPRSCSTAFERSISTLATTKLVSSEPFQHAYYYGPERQTTRYAWKNIDFTSSYKAIAKFIVDQEKGNGKEVVFIKELGLHMKGRPQILEEFFHDAKHSFLIRDPKKSIPSLYRGVENPEIRDWTYFDPSEVGFKELYDIYEFVKEKLDPNPVVIDADDLLSSPNEMMKAYCEGVGIQYEDHMTSWKAGVDLKIWKRRMEVGWRQKAIHSSGFIKPRDKTENRPKVTYPADVIKAIEDSRPLYEKLYSARVRLV